MIVIISLLLALLVPAIGQAVKTARNAAVTAEINQLAQALADFKSKYGDYPPSRILLNENGYYNTTAASLTSYTIATASSPNSVDISDGQLAQRSLAYLRKFFPRFQLSTDPNNSGGIYNVANGFPDFNGNGLLDGSKLLTGDECLVFFLGGLPTKPGTPPACTGFSKNPINPFLPIALAPGNRSQPLIDFKGGRLVDIEGDGFLSYMDSLGTNRPYAYFSSYTGTGYDPNDVNYDTNNAALVESDESGSTSPITLKFKVTFPTAGGMVATSPSPNPYTVGPTNYLAAATNIAPVVYYNAQSFQIISAGGDALFGVGGLYDPKAPEALPLDTNFTNPNSDPQLRFRDRDNLSNIATGRLD